MIVETRCYNTETLGRVRRVEHVTARDQTFVVVEFLLINSHYNWCDSTSV